MSNIRSTERMAGDKMKKLFLIAVLVLGFALSLAYANIRILNDNVLRIGGEGISVTSSQKAAKIYISSTADPGGDGSRADPYDSFSDINWTTGDDNSVYDFITAGTKVYINFKGGETFTGEFEIPTDANGTALVFVTIQSYGTGRAKFTNPGALGNNTKAIVCKARYVTIKNIHVDSARLCGIQAFYGGHYLTVQNCEIENTGMGVHITTGYCTVDNNNIHDLAMVVTDVGGTNDWGAIGVNVAAANATIINNTFTNCKAESEDFGYDGGAIEVYSVASYVTDNLLVAYNTATDCDGFIEVGGDGTGTSAKAIIIGNVGINNEKVMWIHPANVTMTDWKFYHNVFIDSTVHDPRVNNIIGSSTNLTASELVLQNNVFYVGDFNSVVSATFTFTHTHNTFYMANNSTVLNFTLDATDLSSDPHLTSTGKLEIDSPALNAGVVITDVNDNNELDIWGNATDSTPNIGAYQGSGEVVIVAGMDYDNAWDGYTDTWNQYESTWE